MIDYLNDPRIILIMSILKRMQTNDLETEDKKKKFVYDLALLNSLATKGYLATRTTLDDFIYFVKSIACDFLATKYSSRCKYFPGEYDIPHSAVLYVYVAGRQYSYHVNIDSGDELTIAGYDEWDRVEGGWKMTDEEYRQARESCKIIVRNNEPDYRSLEFVKRAAPYYMAAKKYIKERQRYNIVREHAIAKFWTELELTLSYSKKRSQCYQNKYFKECYRRYYSFVQQSFSEEENRAFDYGPSYDKDLIDKICERNKCDYSTALRRLYTVEEYMKQGILSRELLYKIMTDRINNY